MSWVILSISPAGDCAISSSTKKLCFVADFNKTLEKECSDQRSELKSQECKLLMKLDNFPATKQCWSYLNKLELQENGVQKENEVLKAIKGSWVALKPPSGSVKEQSH